MQGPFPENIDQIEDFYRSRLQEAEESVPESLWSKIEEKLEIANKGAAGGSDRISFYKSPFFIGGVSFTIVVASAIFYHSAREEVKPQTQELYQKNEVLLSKDEVADSSSSIQYVAPTSEEPSAPQAAHERKAVDKPVMLEKNTRDSALVSPVVPIQVAPVPSETQEEVEQPLEESISSESKEEPQPKVAKSLYDKLRMQQKDSTRDLFTRKKKK